LKILKLLNPMRLYLLRAEIEEEGSRGLLRVKFKHLISRRNEEAS
jgi:hypothetical protein